MEGQAISGIAFANKCPPPYHPDLKQPVVGQPFMLFMNFHIEEIARQLTIIEFDFFKAIRPWECLGQSWTKKDKEQKAPNILGMISRFNQVSMWVTSSVVFNENPKTRAEVIVRFVEIADVSHPKYCDYIANLNAATSNTKKF